MSEDLRSSFLEFLKRNRLGIAPQSEFGRFCQAFLDRDVLALAPMVREYLGFSDFLSYLEDHARTGLFPTHDEMRRMSDNGYCALCERTFAIQAAICIPESEADLMAYLLQWSKLEAGTVVDVGGGTCHNLTFLKLKGKITGQCVCLDGSSPIIRIAKKVASDEKADIRFIKGTCTELPFPAGSVKQIWMIDVLPWVMNWKKALHEASRILTSGGRVIVAISCTGVNARSDIEVVSAASYLGESGFAIRNVTRNPGQYDCITASKR